MEIQLDMTAVDQLLEEGIYNLVVEDAVVKDSASSGKPILNLRFQVQDSNRKLFETFSLQQQALFRLRDFLVAAGIELKPTGFDTLEILGATVRAKVVKESYEGKERNKIQSYLKAE